MVNIIAFITFAFLHFINIGCSIPQLSGTIASDKATTELCKLYKYNNMENVNYRGYFPILDCSYRNLALVPPNLNNNSLQLQLNNNQLSDISRSPFKSLGLLLALNLTTNNISTLGSDAFTGLSSLEALFISNNKLEKIPDDVFSAIPHLQYLDLTFNLLTQIPNKAIAPLLSLRQLGLQSNYLTSFRLGQEFENLHNLSFLAMANLQLSIKENITNETFQYFRPQRQETVELSILTLDPLSQMSIGKIENVTDLSITNFPIDDFATTECQLKTLTVYYGGVVETLTTYSLQPLAKWNATLISLSLVYGATYHIKGPVFSWVPLLQTLILVDMRIQTISNDTFAGLDYLEELSLSQNYLDTIPSHAMGTFTKHKTLQYLDLSYNKIFDISPDAFDAVPFLTRLNLAGNSIVVMKDWTTKLVNLIELNLEDTYTSLYHVASLPSLQNLYMGVPKQDDIKTLPIKSPFCDQVPTIVQLSIANFKPALAETLIRAVIGKRCSYLKLLDISGTFKGTSAFAETQQPIEAPYLDTWLVAHNDITSMKNLAFMKSPLLQYLDLSSNKIAAVEIDDLSFTDSLRTLNLDNNYLKSLNSLHKFPRMDTLLAARNLITTVPNSLLQTGQESHMTTLNLGGNPFECSCPSDILIFQTWMKKDNITWLVPNDMYICASPDEMKGVQIIDMNLNCELQLELYLSIAVVCVLFATLAVTLSIKYRWHIKYKLFLVFNYRRIKNYVEIEEEPADENMNEQEDLIHPKYDAYIAYADDSPQDELWVLNNLRKNLEEGPHPFQLCIKARDFIPGGCIVETMSESILRSRRTILILTPHFVDSEWCHFEMELAHMRLFNENRDVLILVMLEEVPDNKLTLSLRQLLCTQDFFKWPKDKVGQDLFWKRLRAELMKPVYIDRRFVR